MERAMALGCPQRPLSIKEPHENMKLPSDETSWEQEAPPSEPNLTLASPALSNFAEQCHICFVLINWAIAGWPLVPPSRSAILGRFKFS
ncbi:hypothetical protein TsFJ059_006626 [Trichoderma semiorbis]|uniref:Uncharacterized protein n=1 Tax=Trichoderma semiorbis TaxID=1491008 RepID=A0A9P8HD27_9HYPO|nr:hypothetical protein TsFJ059_006626 [Trichoderma semiorbis]